MAPIEIKGDDNLLMAITAAGRMLLFPVSDLPQLSKGKGNKIVSISSADFAEGKDRLTWLYLLPPQASVTLYFGKRKLVLRPNELQKYQGERGRKGTLLRGLQRIDRIEVDAPQQISTGSSEE